MPPQLLFSTRRPQAWLSRARRLAASTQDRARYWNVTRGEREAGYPCDAYAEPPYEQVLRAIDVAAQPAVVFRWLCQLKLAPYSYDALDNLGRRSPRELTPGVEQLERGQRFLVFDLVDFEPDHHLTGVTFPAARRTFGRIAGTYLVRPAGPASSRLIVKLCISADGPVSRTRTALLAWGDLLMMRKQLLTIKELAEATARNQHGSPDRQPAATPHVVRIRSAR